MYRVVLIVVSLIASLTWYWWYSYLVPLASTAALYSISTTYHLSIICTPVRYAVRKARCEPLLCGWRGSPRYAEAPGVSLMLYGRSTRMISDLIYLARMIQFVRTWYQHLPVCVMCCIVASLCAAVCHTSQWYTASQRLPPIAPSTCLNVNHH